MKLSWNKKERGLKMKVASKRPPDLRQLSRSKGSVLCGFQRLCCASLERQGPSRSLYFNLGQNVQENILSMPTVLTAWFLSVSIYTSQT